MAIRIASIIAGIILLWITACNQEPVEVLSIPDNIAPYVDLFEEEAAKRGLSLTINELIVEFGTDLESSSGDEAAGQCIISSNRNSIPRIVLDTTSFNWTNNLSHREILVFHELGHCVLDRLAHRDDQLNNGNFTSIMRSTGEQLYGAELNGFKRDYYLDELFLPTVEQPEWAVNPPAYGDLTASKSAILTEEFSDTRNNWPLPNNASASGSISGGILTYQSTDENLGRATDIRVPLDQNTDYEIETSIRIASDNGAVYFQWGGRDINNTLFLGFDNGFYVAGKTGSGFSIITELANFNP
ncbi:MAG: hypothetical protein AAFY71_07305, partial [Bacteroidota bacterium]